LKKLLLFSLLFTFLFGYKTAILTTSGELGGGNDEPAYCLSKTRSKLFFSKERVSSRDLVVGGVERGTLDWRQWENFQRRNLERMTVSGPW
jgi:hypothetical protein